MMAGFTSSLCRDVDEDASVSRSTRKDIDVAAKKGHKAVILGVVQVTGRDN